MSKHTKGGWSSEPSKYLVIDKEGKIIANCFFVNKPMEEREANARLIAAAPGLLEALKVAKKRIVELTLMSYASEDASCKTLNKVNEAIAKAEVK